MSRRCVFVDNAIKIASGTPDTGDQFAAQELRIDVLIGLRQLDAAQRMDQEVLSTRARDSQSRYMKRTLYGLAATIAEARNDREAALAALHQGDKPWRIRWA